MVDLLAFFVPGRTSSAAFPIVYRQYEEEEEEERGKMNVEDESRRDIMKKTHNDSVTYILANEVSPNLDPGDAKMYDLVVGDGEKLSDRRVYLRSISPGDLNCYVNAHCGRFRAIGVCFGNLYCARPYTYRCPLCPPPGNEPITEEHFKRRHDDIPTVFFWICLDCLLNTNNRNFICNVTVPKNLKREAGRRGLTTKEFGEDYRDHRARYHRFLKNSAHEVARVRPDDGRLYFETVESPLPLEMSNTYYFAADGATSSKQFRLLYDPY